jgi:hypothetical protein
MLQKYTMLFTESLMLEWQMQSRLNKAALHSEKHN